MIILRSNDLLPDPRVQKYIDFLEKNNREYSLIGWNRSGKKIEKKNTVYFDLKAKYGVGTANIKGIIKWNIYILIKLFKKRKEYSTIHACDFETALPALIMKIFKKKIIFDVFDSYSDCREIRNVILKKVIIRLEKLVERLADIIIICEEERRVQLKGVKNIDKIKILPNIPSYDNDHNVERYSLKTEKINISYVGILSENRGIEELLEVVEKNKELHLRIGGFGSLEDKIKKKLIKNKNIEFFGKVSYEESLKIMNSSDLIYGMYYKVNKNHVLAAPNKYYESLYLEKPLITTNGTLVGDKVKKGNTGYVIDEGYEKLDVFFRITDFSSLIEKSKNAKKLWENHYKNYTEKFLRKNYL